MPISGVVVGVVAVGIPILIVLVIRKIAFPQKLALSDAPWRPNTVNPAHVVALLGLWCTVQVAAHNVLRTWFPGKSYPLKALTGLTGELFLILAVLPLAAWCFRGGLFRGFGLSMRHWIYDTLRGAVGFLAVMPVCMLLLLLGKAVIPERWQAEHDMLQAIHAMEGGWRFLVVLLAVLVAPLAEEMFFRGLLQSMLRRYLRKAWPAVLAASVIFAMMHYQYPQTIPSLLALGIALGYNYERCGRLYPSILMHVLFNGTSIVDVMLSA